MSSASSGKAKVSRTSKGTQPQNCDDGQAQCRDPALPPHAPSSRCCSCTRAGRSGPRRTSARGRSRRASTTTARRRSRARCASSSEETGSAPEPGELDDLGSVRQKSGKVVQAWALEGDLDADAIRSNTFTMRMAAAIRPQERISRGRPRRVVRARRGARADQPRSGRILDRLAGGRS